MDGVGKTLDVFNKVLSVKAKQRRKRRFVPAAVTAYRATDDNQAHATSGAPREESDGLAPPRSAAALP